MDRARGIATLVLVAALLGCGDGERAGGSGETTSQRSDSVPTTAVPTTAVPTTAVPTTAAPTAQGREPNGCLPSDPLGAEIAWERLRNPVFETDAMAKDQALVWADGRWHLLFSSRSDDPRWTAMGHALSGDLSDWSALEERVPGGDSPDVTFLADGRVVVTYQVSRPENPDSRMVVYRVADDLEALARAPEKPLAAEFFPEDRIIDAALAHGDAGLFLFFKRGDRSSVVQPTHVVHSASGSLDGPWEMVGEPDVGWFENYQLLEIDGRWHLLGTRIPVHDPVLYRLDGDPDDPMAWLTWTEVGVLDVPEEDWNSGQGLRGIDYERANSAYLCDARELDGHFYLIYAGSTELDTNEGRGHARIGIARSQDLQTWEVPPG